MEESISRLGQTLASFCNGLESSCHALKQSLDRRPIPLDSASATFIGSLNRRVSSLSGELNLLETMSFGTVSFEELLGHCDQVYKKNQADLVLLTDRLHLLGCNLSSLSEDDAVEVDNISASNAEDMTLELPDSYQGSVLKELEDDSLFGESTCLANLGLSDACLATIASRGGVETNGFESNLHLPLNSYENGLRDYKDQQQNSENVFDEAGEDVYRLKSSEDSSTVICISEEDYESLPSYLKSLVSWEDLQIAVEKINSSIQTKRNTKERGHFHPDELESMSLGPKSRSYLLMLVRMKRLVVETKDGSVSYRVI